MKNSVSLLLLMCFLSFLSCDDQFSESSIGESDINLFEKYQSLVENTSIEKSGRLKYVDSMIDYTKDLPRDTLTRKYLLDIASSYRSLGLEDSTYSFYHKDERARTLERQLESNFVYLYIPTLQNYQLQVLLEPHS